MHFGQQRSAWLKETTVFKLISNIAVVLWNQIITARTCNIPTFRNVITHRCNSRDFGTESFFHFIFGQYSKLNIFQNILTQWMVTFAFIQIIYHQHSPSPPQQYEWLITPIACTTSRVCKFHTCPVTPSPLPPFSPLPFWRAWRAENPVWF